MAEGKASAVKETLQTQQQLLQKVYQELEEERESSATAATEALSMILRLQEEKAAEKMEASQYKRMVEEKMHHAEECLSVFEDLMYSKEMEIASLVFQMQAYRYKLLSLGFTDLFIGKPKFQDNQYLPRNEGQRIMRRYNSLPPAPLEDEGSSIALQGLQVMSEASAVGDCNSYREQIKRLDELVNKLSNRRVVESADSNLISRNSLTMAASSTLMGISRTCSLSAAGSRILPLNPMRSATKLKMDYDSRPSHLTSEVKDSDGFLGFNASINPCLESETIMRSSIHSMAVHGYENNEFCVSQKQEQKKLIFQGQTRIWKQHSLPPETSEYYFKEKDEWIKKVLSYREKLLPKPREELAADSHSPLSDPSQSEVKQLKRRLELLEDDGRIIKQEAHNRGEEQLRLLREIDEQLKAIQFDIDNLKTKKFPSQDESQQLSFIEFGMDLMENFSTD